MTKLLNRDSWLILGLPFDDVTLETAAETVYQSIQAGEPCFISTPNINFTITAQQDEQFYESVVLSDLSIADGMPLIWVAKLLGIPIKERVAGSDLFEFLNNQYDKPKIKVFFFGGQAGVAEIAHRKMNESNSSCISCGYYDPGFVSVDEMSDSKIIEKINAVNPDFVLVALGAKKGQDWILKNINAINAPVISHLGAVMNFVAGTVERAPKHWQRFGLEWLWRIKQEPNLWKRYFKDAAQLTKLVFCRLIPLFLYEKYMYKSYYSVVDGQAIYKGDGVNLSGWINHKCMEQIKEALQLSLEAEGEEVHVDFNRVSFVDSSFLATLLLYQCELNRMNRRMICLNLNRNILKLFRYSGIENKFEIRL